MAEFQSLEQINEVRAGMGLPPLSMADLTNARMLGSDPFTFMELGGGTGGGGAGRTPFPSFGLGTFNYGPVPGSGTFPGTGEEDGSETGDQGGELGDEVDPVPLPPPINFFGQAPTGDRGQFTTDDILVSSSEQPNMYDAVFAQQFAPLNPYATPAPTLNVPAPRETPNLVFETEAPTPVEPLPAPAPPVQIVPEPAPIAPIVPEPSPPVSPTPPTPPPVVTLPVEPPPPVTPVPVPPPPPIVEQPLPVVGGPVSPPSTMPVPEPPQGPEPLPPVIGPPVTMPVPEPPPVELAPPKPLPPDRKQPVVTEQPAPPTFAELLDNYTKQGQELTKQGQSITRNFQLNLRGTTRGQEPNLSREERQSLLDQFKADREEIESLQDANRRTLAQGIMALSPEERAMRLDNPQMATILGNYYDPETKGIIGLAMGGSVNIERGSGDGIESFLMEYRDPESQMQERRNATFMRNMRMAQQPQMPQGPQPTALGTMQQGIMPIAKQRQ